jgi:hypothetical protein
MNIPDFKQKFGVDAYIPERDGILYKYFSIERGIQCVLQEALYFASPSQLNDSFELDIAKIKFEMTDANIWKLLKRRHPGSDTDQQAAFEKSKEHRDKVPAIMKEQLSKLRDACGVCCFTTKPVNKLMWAHYGQSDTGIVVGFNLPPYSPHLKDFFVMKVLYEQERSFIDYFEKSTTLFPLWAFIKNSEWAYENEIRAVKMDYNGLLKYNIESVQEIHYGMKTDPNMIGRLEAVMALKNYHSYKRFQISHDPNSYGYKSQPF